MMGVFGVNIEKRKSLLMAGAFAFVVLVFGISSQYWGSGRTRVHEAIEPDISALLPSGAVKRAMVELPDAPQTARAVVYVMNGVESLALVSWSLEQNKFLISSGVAYNGEQKPLITKTLTAESFGLGAPVAVLARGPVDATTELVAVFARKGDALSQVMLTGVDGIPVPAQFIVGKSASLSSDVSFQDVDGDGDKDAVVISADIRDGASINEKRIVYSWNDGGFVYEPELSKVMSMRSALFPEPEGEPLVPQQ